MCDRHHRNRTGSKTKKRISIMNKRAAPDAEGGGGSGDGREGGEKRVKVNEDVAAIRAKTAASRAHLVTVHPADCGALIK